MKILKILIIVCSLVIVSSCKKEAITSDKENYIGLWVPEIESPDEKLEIQVNSDGSGHYISSKPGKTFEATGNVYFKNANEFSIGGKIFKKNIKINRAPVRILDSLKPYKFHYEATFNDTKFKKKES